MLMFLFTSLLERTQILFQTYDGKQNAISGMYFLEHTWRDAPSEISQTGDAFSTFTRLTMNAGFGVIAKNNHDVFIIIIIMSF
jgi:hypothetical protein